MTILLSGITTGNEYTELKRPIDILTVSARVIFAGKISDAVIKNEKGRCMLLNNFIYQQQLE